VRDIAQRVETENEWELPRLGLGVSCGL
jgi:hypothetical protein